MAWTPESRSFTKHLLGSKPHSNPDTQQLHDEILYDFDMGYYTPMEVDPFTSTAYHAVENEFYHPFSFEEIGRKYGLNKLEEFISLEAYLRMPAAFVDPILAGVVKGKIQREERTPTVPEEPTQEEVEREVERQLKNNS